MIIKFEKVTAHIHHLSNFYIAEEVVLCFLTSEILTNIARLISMNEIYVFFHMEGAPLEIVS